MPAKTRPKRKPVPAILRTPIEAKLDLLHKVFGNSTPQAEAEERRIREERCKRLKEVFKFYDVEPSNPQDLMRLLWLMAADLFPDGFKCVPEGEDKTRKTEWTATRKRDLLVFMRACLDCGYTQVQAAELYVKTFAKGHGHRSATGIVTRYHEAENWIAAGKLTENETLDLIESKYRADSYFIQGE